MVLFVPVKDGFVPMNLAFTESIPLLPVIPFSAYLLQQEHALHALRQ
jgi:hypothetical protein